MVANTYLNLNRIIMNIKKREIATFMIAIANLILLQKHNVKIIENKQSPQKTIAKMNYY